MYQLDRDDRSYADARPVDGCLVLMNKSFFGMRENWIPFDERNGTQSEHAEIRTLDSCHC